MVTLGQILEEAMIELLADVPLCLDCSGEPNKDGCDEHRRCTRPATFEMFHGSTGDGWGAYCSRCIKFWNPKHVEIRELTEKTTKGHFWAQSREGGRLRSHAHARSSQRG